MSITQNLNLIIGGQQVGQLAGSVAVETLNLIFEGRVLAHTHDAYSKLHELRSLAQAINVAITPGARRLQAVGAKTELLFNPNDSLSLFHIIGENITLRQAELRFVTGQIASHGATEEEADNLEDDHEFLAEAMADQIESVNLQVLLSKLGEIAEESDDFDICLALLNIHGEEAVLAALKDLGIQFNHPVSDEEDEEDEFADEELTPAALLLDAIQDQLNDDQIQQLVEFFMVDEEDDDEEEVILQAMIEKFGVQGVLDQILVMVPSFDVDPEDDEEEGGGAPLSEYVLNLLRNELEALPSGSLTLIAADVLDAVDGHYPTAADKIDALLMSPMTTLQVANSQGIELPNFSAAIAAMDDDEDREERLDMLDLQDLEILCDVMGIDHQDQDHDDIISLLSCRPQSEFDSALEIANITLPEIDYNLDEPSAADHRETFAQLAGLTMLQSAVATSLAEGQDLVLSFTH